MSPPSNLPFVGHETDQLGERDRWTVGARLDETLEDGGVELAVCAASQEAVHLHEQLVVQVSGVGCLAVGALVAASSFQVDALLEPPPLPFSF